MRRSYMMILLAVLASLVVVGSLVDPRTWLSDVAIGVGEDVRVLEQDEVEQIEKKHEHVKRRIMAEQGIVFDLITGDLTLREAVGQIRANRTKEELEFLVENLRRWHEGKSENEVLCRHLVSEVEEFLSFRTVALPLGRALTDAEREQYDQETRAVMSRLNRESKALI